MLAWDIFLCVLPSKITSVQKSDLIQYLYGKYIAKLNDHLDHTANNNMYSDYLYTEHLQNINIKILKYTFYLLKHVLQSNLNYFYRNIRITKIINWFSINYCLAL